ncbi:MAG: HK97 gp10 family phage protein [Vicinamibacterales bacterium]
MKAFYALTGDKEMLQKIEALARSVPQKVAGALYVEAEIEMAKMKERTPVASGTLRNSGHVELPEITPSSVTVRLGFGGPAASYAVYVHEDLEARHEVGQAKYLSSVLDESEPFLLGRVAARLKLME